MPPTRKRRLPRRNEILSSSPLVEITLLHRAMRLELESMCQLADDLVVETTSPKKESGDDADGVAKAADAASEDPPSVASCDGLDRPASPPAEGGGPPAATNPAASGDTIAAGPPGARAAGAAPETRDAPSPAPPRPAASSSSSGVDDANDDDTKGASSGTRIDELLGRFMDFDVVFSSHSSAEDDFIFPMLASRGSNPLTSSSEVMMQEHSEETIMMSDADAALRAAAAAGRVDAHTRDLVRTLKEKLSEHMLMEEEALFPSLASFSSDELSRMVGLVMGSRSAEALEATIRMEVTHLDAQHARHVLSTMCHVARATNFKNWLAAKFRGGDFDQALRAKRARRNRYVLAKTKRRAEEAAAARAHKSSSSAEASQQKKQHEAPQQQQQQQQQHTEQQQQQQPPEAAQAAAASEAEEETPAATRSRAGSFAELALSVEGPDAPPPHAVEDEGLGPACPYYGHRGVSLVAACCGARVCCRRCHDDRRTCPRSMDAKAVSLMVCAKCGLEQPVGADCRGCDRRVASYYCHCCRHLDDTGAPTYHCPYCNVCRRGHGLGIDYAHCMTCNHCVLLSSFPTHFCSAEQTCAVCANKLFASTDHVITLDCGHPKHAACPAAPCLICARAAATTATTTQAALAPPPPPEGAATTSEGGPATMSKRGIVIVRATNDAGDAAPPPPGMIPAPMLLT